VRTILISSTLFLTVTSAVCLGVVAAYAAVQAVLHTFARQPRPAEESSPALVTQEATIQQ